MSEPLLPVLIVGAGPTGLTLACGLARRGVPFRLIEAADGPQAGSRGKGVQPRTLEVLGDLGVVDRVLANGRMAMPVRMVAPDGQVRMSAPVPTAATSDFPYAASVVTPEWRVEEALRDRLEELGGRVEFGTSLGTLTQTDEVVTATLLSGDATETVTARWLVGCDGGHSTARKQAGLPFVGETRDDVRMIVADVAVEGLDRDAWTMWRHEEGLVNLCPLPSTDLFQLQASIAPGQDASLDLAHIQAVLDRRSGRNDLRLAEPGWRSLWRANVRLAAHYREGRVLLAGDAAHIHSPAGGQGMNTGIQDAHNLAWKLAAVEHGADSALVDTYEAERRPVAAEVLALSDARLAQTMRERAIPTKRDASTTQLAVGYRGGPLTVDDHDDDDDDASLRAGDRAPDAAGLRTADGERRLFDLTRGGRFTLLAFGEAPELDGVTVLRVNADLDRERSLARTYGATDRTLVLIRPDGHIGLISDTGDASAVRRYLARVGAA